MTKPLDLLQNCTDIHALRPLLHAICMGFGTVARLDILKASQIGKRQALCFLRMATSEQEEHLMRELGAGRFGGDIVVIVDLCGDGFSDSLAGKERSHKKQELREWQPTSPVASIAARLGRLNSGSTDKFNTTA
jgi:hypothetical protein